MEKDMVKNLAKLARIQLGESEVDDLTREFEAILGYVGEVKNVTDNRQSTTDKYATKNIMREDSEPHQSGIYTEKLLSEAPAREGDFIKVKKIL